MQNSPATSVEALILSASRRRHALLALEQTKFALTFVLAGAILLLLLGTQILDWYWLVLLAVVGSTIGIFRFRRRRLSHYEIAQILDGRLKLSDTLSTAWFVLKTPAPAKPTSQLQLNHAERVASVVQPRIVFPTQRLRTWTTNALLFFIVFALFSVRYFSYDQLSFRQTLLPIHFGQPSPLREAKLHESDNRPQQSDLRKKPDLPPIAANSPRQQNSDDGRGPASPDEKKELEQEAIASREVRQPNGQPNSNAFAQSQEQQTPSGEMHDSSNSPNDPASSKQAGPQHRPSTNSSSNHQEQQPTSKDASSEEQSLTSKLRDVLSGLLAKMQEGTSQQRGDAGGNQSHTPNQNRNEPGTNRNEQSNSHNNPGQQAQSNSLQSQQSAQNADTASNSPSKGSGNAAGHRSSDTRSAAGRQDGSKDPKETEELRAMGKLEEIIGKRSANLTGEMTIDSRSGTQQLRTGYTNQSGSHSGIGSEIDHDQIPMEDQPYVREYMKQVHEQPDAR